MRLMGMTPERAPPPHAASRTTTPSAGTVTVGSRRNARSNRPSAYRSFATANDVRATHPEKVRTPQRNSGRGRELQFPPSLISMRSGFPF